MEVLIRKATEQDAGALAVLARTFAESNASPSPAALTDLARADSGLKRLLREPNTTVLVAESQAQLVGATVLASIPSLVHGGRDLLFMDLLVVGETDRRRGVGRSLVRRAIEMARETRAYKLLLVTGTDNQAATALYKTCGFEVNGLALAFYT